MKGYLLDTNVALIAVATPERLSTDILEAIAQGPSFLSVIAYWEVTIKAMKGTFDVGDARQWWTETLEALALQPLLFRPEHIAAVHDLPPFHQDPFDRAMIAQATVEDLTLLTTDGVIARCLRTPSGDALTTLMRQSDANAQVRSHQETIRASSERARASSRK